MKDDRQIYLYICVCVCVHRCRSRHICGGAKDIAKIFVDLPKNAYATNVHPTNFLQQLVQYIFLYQVATGLKI